MQIPVRTRLLRNFNAALDQIDGVKLCERARSKPIRKDHMPYIGQYRGSEDARNDFTGEDGATMRVLVRLAVAQQPEERPNGRTSDEATEDALEELIAKVLAKMGELANRSLGGLAERVDYVGLEDPETVDVSGAPDHLAGTVIFEVLFATVEGDPYTVAHH